MTKPPPKGRSECLSPICCFCVCIFFFNNIYLFIFGCAGSSLLRGLFSTAASRGYSLVAVYRFLLF